MPDTSEMTRRSPALLAGLAVLALGLITPASATRSAEPERIEPEVSPSAVALLKLLNTAPEKKLVETLGLTAPVVKKVMERRARDGGYKNLVEFVETTGIAHADFETLLKPFQEEETQQRLDAERPPVPDPATKAKPGRLQQSAGAQPQQAKGNRGESSGGSGPIGAVRPGFYSKIPGYEDLDKIDPLKRTEFLESVNRELCSCGCKNETVAFCIVNDPGCPVIKARVKKIYDDIMTKAPR